MTRETALDELKQTIRIDDLARELGLEVKGKQARCFNTASHKNGDKHFSLGLDLDANRFKCFACGVKGSVIDLYMQVKGVDLIEAIKALSPQGSIKPVRAYKEIKEPETAPALVKGLYEGLQGLYEGLQGFCQGLDAESLNYLRGKNRGLNRDTIDRFKLFSIKDYGATNSYLKETFTREQLKQAGLISDEGNLIFYKHKIIIPFYESGAITFLQARRLDAGQPRYLHLKKPVSMFNLDALNGLKAGDKLYICEGAFDAMILEQAGFRAIAILGVNNFKPESVKLFKGLDVILCLDNDESGHIATRAISNTFLTQGQLVKAKALPNGVKDITEYFTL